MFTNNSEFNRIEINRIVEHYISNIPKNVPVEIEKVNDDLTLNCKSIIDSRTFTNVQICTPIGYSYNPNRLKYGILLNVPYYFYSILSDGSISEAIISDQTQFGLFIPILDNENKFDKESDVALYDKDAKNIIKITKDNITSSFDGKNIIDITTNGILLNKDNKSELNLTDNVELNSTNGSISIAAKTDELVFDNGISLNSSTPIEFKTQIASLKDIVDGLIECINLASIPTSTAPGTPATPNPGLTAKIVELQTKINGVLK